MLPYNPRYASSITCPSSGGQIVLSQHPVSSLSVNGLQYAPQSALNRHTVQPFTESGVTGCCDNTICPPEDGHVMLETCRGL